MAWKMRVIRAEAPTEVEDPETHEVRAVNPQLSVGVEYWDEAKPARKYVKNFTFVRNKSREEVRQELVDHGRQIRDVFAIREEIDAMKEADIDL